MDDWPIIFSYTRAEAIADGVLVDITAQAAEVCSASITPGH